MVRAEPTKRFFVEMLTRDIALDHAIMDLIDNCVDGIVRRNARNPPASADKPYLGYTVRIAATRTRFEIRDNCGGIPRKIARTSAFMLGRHDSSIDAHIPTVGMYGIGMKRAIFKLGMHCEVASAPQNESPYVVTISPEWLAEDGNWELPMVEDKGRRLGQATGTAILVSQLHDTVSRQLDATQSQFLGDLRKDISSFYSLIIQKGLNIDLNGERIAPVNLELLSPSKITATGISPYVFEGRVKEVDIQVVVGFYRPLATERELNNELRSPRSKDEAGWTVVCNDRVVLHRDKSYVTGWGRANVPRYHNQFIAISGVVSFSTNVPLNLPLNTTKRGLDYSSELYQTVLELMQEGLQKFTSFTNKWKTREAETEAAFAKLKPAPPRDIASRVPQDAWTAVRKLGGNARRFLPSLPKPPSSDRVQRISFARPRPQVVQLSRHFFEHDDATPSEVGQRCFDAVYEEVARGGK